MTLDRLELDKNLIIIPQTFPFETLTELFSGKSLQRAKTAAEGEFYICEGFMGDGKFGRSGVFFVTV